MSEKPEKKEAQVIVVLENAALDTVKTAKGHQLLNCDDHKGIHKKHNRDPSASRPDILHQELMALLDSPLNKAGYLKVYIRSAKNVLIEVSPQMRVPRTYKRFAGLMVQLLHTMKIRSADNKTTLLKVIKNPIDIHLPPNVKKYGCSRTGELIDPWEFVTELPKEPVVFVLGAMAHGHITKEMCPYIDEMVSLSEYPLSGAQAISRLLNGFERHFGRMRFLWLISAAIMQAMAQDTSTAIIVGAKASWSGAPLTTHSNDCADCDFRLVKVPAMSHEADTTRAVYAPTRQYPRYVGTDRANEYKPEMLDARFYNWTSSVPIGFIPQVPTTYGYLEGVYGIMNEHQLAMGESTCGARFAALPVSEGGSALLDITELSRIALERTTTARDAIALMGNLSETHGFYGSGWNEDDAKLTAGEALTITDASEAWVFHVLPDDTGSSAVWAAQRVPDDSIAVVANEFVIRKIDFEDSDNFMFSSNMQSVAERNGFWDGSTPFDFTATFAYTESSMDISTRRVWRIFSLANPSLSLNAFTNIYASDYPFSVKPSTQIDASTLISFLRDHYEGTPFDLTQGPAAGPYGDPDRYSLSTKRDGGRFERAISIQRSTYSFVASPNANNTNLGLLWFGPHASYTNAFIPLYVKLNHVPSTLSQGSLRSFNFNSTYWLNTLIGNYASQFYKFTHPVIAQVQQELESTNSARLVDLERVASVMVQYQGEAAMKMYLTTNAEIMAQDTHDVFMALMNNLITRFHDGYILSNVTQQFLTIEAMGYPDWYLKAVGYYSPLTANNTSMAILVFFIILLVIMMSVGVGFHYGRKRAARKKGYVPTHDHFDTLMSDAMEGPPEPVAPWNWDNIPDYGPLKHRQHVASFLLIGVAMTLVYEYTTYFDQISREIAYPLIWVAIFFRLLAQLSPQELSEEEELLKREKEEAIEFKRKLQQIAQENDEGEDDAETQAKEKKEQ